MWVTFNKQGEDVTKIMSCFYDNPDEQIDLMNRGDIDKQVKEWQKSNLGQPPKFYSRLYNFEFISDKEAARRNIIFPK